MLSRFEFTPAEGFLSTEAYPTDPQSEEEAREQLFRPFGQVRDFFNGTFLRELAESTGAESVGAGPLYEGDAAGSVADKLLALRAAIDDIVLGGVPDGSITTEKLSGDLVMDGGSY